MNKIKTSNSGVKLPFNPPTNEFLKYLRSYAEGEGFKCAWRPPTSLIIMGINDKALEVDCEGTEARYYYFASISNDAISYCDELQLEDPKSIEIIISLLKLLCESS